MLLQEGQRHGMECAGHHRILESERAQSPSQFGSGLTRESDDDGVKRIRRTIEASAGDSSGEDRCLSRPGSRYDSEERRIRSHRSLLVGIETADQLVQVTRVRLFAVDSDRGICDHPIIVGGRPGAPSAIAEYEIEGN